MAVCISALPSVHPPTLLISVRVSKFPPVQHSHLTRVPAPVVVARAHEDVRNDLVAAGAEEHLLAALVAHDWHRYLRRERGSEINI